MILATSVLFWTRFRILPQAHYIIIMLSEASFSYISITYLYNNIYLSLACLRHVHAKLKLRFHNQLVRDRNCCVTDACTQKTLVTEVLAIIVLARVPWVNFFTNQTKTKHVHENNIFNTIYIYIVSFHSRIAIRELNKRSW